MRRPSGGLTGKAISWSVEFLVEKSVPSDDTFINKNSRKVKSGACGNPAASLEFLIGWSRQSSVPPVDFQVKGQTETSSDLLETPWIGELGRSAGAALSCVLS